MNITKEKTYIRGYVSKMAEEESQSVSCSNIDLTAMCGPNYFLRCQDLVK